MRLTVQQIPIFIVAYLRVKPALYHAQWGILLKSTDSALGCPRNNMLLINLMFITHGLDNLMLATYMIKNKNVSFKLTNTYAYAYNYVKYQSHNHNHKNC